MIGIKFHRYLRTKYIVMRSVSYSYSYYGYIIVHEIGTSYKDTK